MHVLQMFLKQCLYSRMRKVVNANVHGKRSFVRPNAEPTGRRQRGGLVVLPMMSQGNCPAKLACRRRVG